MYPFSFVLFLSSPKKINNQDACVKQLLVRVLNNRKPSLTDAIRGELGRSDSQLESITGLYQQSEKLQAALGAAGADGAVSSAMFAAFRPFQNNFARLLRADLKMKPAFSTPVATASVDEIVAAAQQSVPAVFERMDAAVARCGAFTQGHALGGLVASLDDFAGGYYDTIKASLPALRKQAEAEAAAALAEDSDQVEDWAQTRAVFSLIETCGTILQRSKDFEAALRTLAKETSAAGAGAGAGAGGMEPRAKAAFAAAASQLGRAGPALPTAHAKLSSLNDALHSFAYETVLSPLTRKLTSLAAKPEWTDGSEDGFSASPLAYITQVGEQLLTLPQQLEPFMGDDDDDTAGGSGGGAGDGEVDGDGAESAANSASNINSSPVAVALRNSKLPVAAVFDGVGEGEVLSVSDEWLGSAAQGVMNRYVEEIVKIAKVTPAGAAQLSADIDYLCNVLSALDVSPSADLNHANQLLSAEADGFAAMVTGLAPKPDLAKAIQKMRGL